MTTYYNDNDPSAAEWLRELIRRGLLPGGEVDERSIVEVPAEDLIGFDACHFFAGIGGWPHALALAGWPDGREVWTGSCPCQPFSVAGVQEIDNDDRDLWPAFLELIRERQPAVIFGEQVAGADGYGWLSGVRSDLEKIGYAFGAADLPAAGVGAPLRRQRLYWVASTESRGRRQEWNEIQGTAGRRGGPGYWNDYRTMEGERGKRRLGPGVMSMVDGFPGGMERKRFDLRLRGYGNAIVPQLAAKFIEAYATA